MIGYITMHRLWTHLWQSDHNLIIDKVGGDVFKYQKLMIKIPII